MRPLLRTVQDSIAALVALVFWQPVAGELVPVGLARVDISPKSAVPLMGYAARANLPAPADVAQRIHARALAIGEGADAAIVLTIDNCILPGAITNEVRRRLAEKLHVRPENVALTVTHTHSAPCLSGAAPNLFGRDIPAEDQAAIDAYTRFFTDEVERAAVAAMSDRRPAQLAWGKGSAGFAKNRRTPGGPVDHEMPMLRISTPEGKVRGIFVSYACHCTTLVGDFNAVHGDWAGVAAHGIERDFPDAVGLVAIGCGADSNPEPRGSVELATKHGEEIASETRRVLATKLAALSRAPECRLKTLQLPFQPAFSREEWMGRAAAPGIVGFHARKWLARLDRGEVPPTTLPYPVQTWSFGDELAIVFLGGEVVVDYSLRLKRELDPHRLWINAYSNDVPCYIPSRRVLGEGGYEPESSLWYYDRPQRLAPEIEDLIIGAVRELLPKSFLVNPAELEKPPPKKTSDALPTFRLRAGFEIELVASEPLIESPVAIDFGSDGRLWVCEMRDYPSGMDGNGKPGGRVKVLSDSDGDGQFDRVEIWADDLPFPTGLMAWRDGVLVCAAPDIWFISKSRREKLLSGFATENFQARVNGLRWGLDGWVHGSGGLFGGKITVAKSGATIDCTNRDFRFRPDTGEFEPLAGVSQQGHVRNDFDQWFGNDNSTFLWQFPLPDRYSRRNPHAPGPSARVSISRDADPGRVFPASRTLTRFNDPQTANRITSGCSPEIYRDELCGAAFAGNAFACEPVHNLVRRAVLEPDGVLFAARRAPDEEHAEFLASTDNWFRPVEVRTGPDGALWVVDMYRFVVEHPRWIPPKRLKELDVRAGAEKGRIWRVLPAGVNARTIQDLTKLSSPELARVIDSPNGVERDLADRLLRESIADMDAAGVQELERIATQSKRPASRVQSLAALHHLGGPKPETLESSLRDPDPRVRRFAVKSFEGQKPGAAMRLLPALVHDPDATVRYQLSLTLGDFDDAAAAQALAELAVRDGASEWHRAAILSSALAQPSALARAMASKAVDASLREALLTSFVAAGRSDAIGEWLITAFPPEAQSLTGAAMIEALRLVALLTAKPEISHAILHERNSPAARALDGLTRQLSASAAARAKDRESPEAARVAAIQLLAEQARTEEAHRRELLALLDCDLPDAVAPALFSGLRMQQAKGFADELLRRWTERAPAQRGALLGVLLTRKEWLEPLLAAAGRGEVSAVEFSPAQREQLREHPKAAKLFPPPAADRIELVRRFSKVADLPGDAARGAAQFDRLCATCHALRGRGHAVGPDLSAFREKPVADFLVAILDPNAAIEPRYAAWSAETKAGRVISGVVRDESSAAITFVQPGGTAESVPRADLARTTPLPRSLMPEGLEAGLTPSDLADLIAWIRTGS